LAWIQPYADEQPKWDGSVTHGTIGFRQRGWPQVTM
jgi:hypothetical protein